MIKFSRDNYSKKFVDKIIESKMAKDEVAEKLSVTVGAVNFWVHGTIPNGPNRKKIRDLFGIALDEDIEINPLEQIEMMPSKDTENESGPFVETLHKELIDILIDKSSLYKGKYFNSLQINYSAVNSYLRKYYGARVNERIAHLEDEEAEK